MALLKKGPQQKRVRLFYATDVHGSERTYRKFINGAKFYKVDHLVMGGDIMGKFLIPIVNEGGGHYRVTLEETLHHLDGESAVTEFKDRIETLGFYHVTVSEDELRAMQADQSRVDAAFRAEAHARLSRWIALADERLAGTAVHCYVTGGNDDPQHLMDVLEEARASTSSPARSASCSSRRPSPWPTAAGATRRPGRRRARPTRPRSRRS